MVPCQEVTINMLLGGHVLRHGGGVSTVFTLETTSLVLAEVPSSQGWALWCSGKEEVAATTLEAEVTTAMLLSWGLRVWALDGTTRVGKGKRRIQ